MDPDTIWSAIFEQESGSGRNNRTSVTGAMGPGQIQPQTFSQYALPGESISNYDDNIRVSKRIVYDYYNKFGGDPARIATAYFSGPGNVAPEGSQQAFLKNRSDPTGKSVSSYVSDVTGRLNKMASNFDADAAFGQWEAATPPKGDSFNPEAAFSQWEKPARAVQASTPSGSRVPVPVEGMSPQQLAEYQAGIQRGKEGPPGWLSENYHPLSALIQTAQAGGQQFAQGLGEILQSKSASGVGNVGMGAINATIGALFAPYMETTRAAGQAIGQPQAANVASLIAPVKGVPATVSSALPTARSANQIIKLVGEENIPAVIQKLENNPNLSLMDVSQPVKTVAAGLANSPETPAAQNIMRGAYEARTAGRKDVIQQAIDRTLGPEINVKDYLDTLKENVRKVGEQRINPAIEGSQPIGVMPMVQRLDEIIKAPGTSDQTIDRLSKLKDQLTAEAGKDGFIDPQKLHGIQWRLRAEAENLAKSASGADRNLSGPLFNARNDMVNAIDAASGGKYRPALAGFRSEANIQDAFDKGFNIFKTGGVEDFPEYWKAWASEAQPAEIAAAKVGALTAARKQIQGMQGGARRGENITSVDFARDRLASIFGPQQTEKLSGLLEDARSMAETNALLYQNSKTGLVQAGRDYFKPREVGKSGMVGGIGAGLAGSMLMAGGAFEPGLLGLAISGAKGVHTAGQYIARLSDKGTATKFAQLASATGPERNQLISLLRSASGGNKSGNLIPSLVRLAAP